MGARAAADAVVSVPQNIVNMSSGLFVPEAGISDIHDVFQDPHPSETELKRRRGLAILDDLRLKTQQKRRTTWKKPNETRFTCATSVSEKPSLFEFVAIPQSTCSSTPSLLPYYLCVRVGRTCKKQRDMINNGRCKFWYAVPRDHAEQVYHFLLQWTPNKYGTVWSHDDDHEEDDEQSAFLLLDDGDHHHHREMSSSPPIACSLNRQWELVSVDEMRHRLSLTTDNFDDLPLPMGATCSRILDQAQIRQVVQVLPVRAEGYSWIRVYNSEEDGFSLSTLYRRMHPWTVDADSSPTLLIIRSVSTRIFGAILSAPLHPDDHFCGTGAASLLWQLVPTVFDVRLVSYRWTGTNQFFVKASKDSLVVGAGGGHYGLWLDADLNHGRSTTCDTFNNEPLAGDEDFIVQDLEAFCFRML